MAALAHIFCFLAVLLAASSVRAASACEEETAPWIARCAERVQLTLVVRSCPANRLVIGVPSADFDVELSTGGVPAFRRTGNVGVSPVGDFPNWGGAAEKPRRDALEAVESCIRADPGVPFVVGRPTTTTRRSPPPWLLLVGVVLAAGLAFVRVKRVRTFGAGLLVFVVATLLVWVSRKLLFPFSFFHQNGIGPGWVDMAFANRPSEYGPGFPELFGAVARAAGSRPEQGIFWLSSAIGATVPALGFVTARSVGASRAVAGALFLGLSIDPALLRTAHSESYFSVIVALLFAAGSAIAAATWRAKVRSPAFVLGVLAAGFFVAQAARIHPIAWVPAALIPLVAFLGPGSSKRRAIACLVAGLGIACVVLLTTGPTLYSVARGSLGNRWLSQASPHWRALPQALPLFLMAALVVVAVRGRRGLVVGGVALRPSRSDSSPTS